MAGPYSGSSKGLGFYQSIWSAATQGATTSEVWLAMNEAALSTAQAVLGWTVGSPFISTGIQALANSYLAGVSIQDVNQMRAIAGQNIRAAQALASADGTLAIDSSMIGEGPVRATGMGTGLPESYAARVQYETIDEFGVTGSDWLTVQLDELPDTVSDLRDTVGSSVSDQVAAYTAGGPATSVSAVKQIVLQFN